MNDRLMQREYTSEVADKLSKLGLYVDVDNGENTLPKKIRNGEIAQYNFILGASPPPLSIFPPLLTVTDTYLFSQSSGRRSSTAARSTCATATTWAPRRARRRSRST